jgi:hypothetical protein
MYDKNVQNAHKNVKEPNLNISYILHFTFEPAALADSEVFLPVEYLKE